MKRWFDESGFDEDVIISTRIRIARNLKDYNFPQMMKIEDSEKLTQNILNAMKDISSNGNYKFIRINDLSPLKRRGFMEEHLISPGLMRRPDYGSFLLRDDGNVNIMINEEDHIRIQVLFPGLNFERAWEIGDAIDDYLEKSLDFAFHEDFGYLTACPTNCGTGLRASVMVHIPSLALTGYVNNLIQGLNKLGLAVRGIYGEGSNAVGNMYQISNQITLGEGEERIIEKLKSIIYQVINKERDMRNALLDKRKDEMEDRIFRSLGILKYSRIISSKEAMRHISNVRLGMEMGIITEVDFRKITKLMIEIQPANIQGEAVTEMSKEDRDIKRANLIRNTI